MSKCRTPTFQNILIVHFLKHHLNIETFTNKTNGSAIKLTSGSQTAPDVTCHNYCDIQKKTQRISLQS